MLREVGQLIEHPVTVVALELLVLPGKRAGSFSGLSSSGGPTNLPLVLVLGLDMIWSGVCRSRRHRWCC